MARCSRTLIVLGAVAAAAVFSRRRLSVSGATVAEQTMPLPGDNLIPGATLGSAMAANFSAPPAEVWKWLIQMGSDRAGFYSWDRLDNAGRPSAERINPDWQDLKQGDCIDSMPDGSHWFDVALLVPERTLVLRAPIALPRGAMFKPDAGPPPDSYNDSTWGFHLFPLEDGGTRLLVRGTWAGRPQRLLAIANWLIWDPAHWIMQRRQFSQLRRRVDAGGAGR